MRVLAGGCFNKIHLGHVYFLRECKQKGSSFWLVLAHDKHNRKLSFRPIETRIRNVRNLKIADKVMVGSAGSFLGTIKKIKPGIICLGYDQALPRGLKNYIKEKKISVERVEKLKGYSKRGKRAIGRVFGGGGKQVNLMKVKSWRNILDQRLKKKFFPGTLNLMLSHENVFDLFKKDKFRKMPVFPGEKGKHRRVLAYPVKLRNAQLLNKVKEEKAWVVIPLKTGYNSRVIEVIHPQNLKELFGLGDNDLVEVIF